MKNILLTEEENYFLQLIVYKKGKRTLRLASKPAHYLKALIRFALIKKMEGKNSSLSRTERRVLNEDFYRYLNKHVRLGNNQAQ